ncbi:hypothetical protein F5144DRAFT_592036 [Chaetomium tenue]|uniref:Uncharacterized protein n=1 Tax=Chaetomium tenue TaxID=1854479 RepID=A0ACB7PI95_9PEZI|nr:hypothetical protein F5144DRAFT_592036 [Chaetomium globosum]
MSKTPDATSVWVAAREFRSKADTAPRYREVKLREFDPYSTPSMSRWDRLSQPNLRPATSPRDPRTPVPKRRRARCCRRACEYPACLGHFCRIPFFAQPQYSHSRLSCASPWPMTWLSGLVVQIQYTLHSAKLPASLLIWRRAAFPMGQVRYSEPRISWPSRQEPRLVRGAAVVRGLLLVALFNLTLGFGVSGMPGVGPSGGCHGPVNIKCQNRATGTWPDSQDGRTNHRRRKLSLG